MKIYQIVSEKFEMDDDGQKTKRGGNGSLGFGSVQAKKNIDIL